MKENFKPEDYKEFRDDLAQEIKSIPKEQGMEKRTHEELLEDEEKEEQGISVEPRLPSRKELLHKLSWSSEEFKISKMLHRQEVSYVNELIKNGEVKTREEGEQKWREKLIENEAQIRNWLDNDLCSPEKVPYDLLENKERLETLDYDIEKKANEKINLLMPQNPDIVDLVDSLKFSDKDGSYRWNYYGDREIPNNEFLDVSKEQREKIDEIKSDPHKLGLLLHELRDKKGASVFANNFNGFNSPTGGTYYVKAEKNLKALFGSIPYLVSDGDRHYSIKPFGNRGNNKTGDYIKGYYTEYIGWRNQPDQIKVLAGYGAEDGKKLNGNLNATFELARKMSVEKKLDADLVVSFKENYMKVKQEMPELLEFARKFGKDGSLQEIDFENKVATFLGGRSEYGSSGGIGYWSVVTAWNNGKSQQKEFQYRDRYSASKDDWSYNFQNLKIASVEEKEGKTVVTILGNPGDKQKTIKFDFEAVPVAKKEEKPLSLEEQMAFQSEVNNAISEILTEKANKIRGSEQMKQDYSGHEPYRQPYVKEVVFDEQRGIAAFSVIEQIDAGSPVDIKMPQERCELYVAKLGEKVKEIDRDHAYVIQVEHPAYQRVKDSDSYGDPTMASIKIMDDKISYSTRKGRKEYTVK